MKKLLKLITAINPSNEPDFYVQIGYYWVLNIDGNIVKCILDNNRSGILNEKCKLENELQFNKSDLKNLYGILNGYLKGKVETISSN